MRGSNGRYPPIESHAIIGDLQTAALVTLDGTIDFLCLPHFDSPSVFASLLDADKGGCFAITPDLDQPRHKQLYLPDTNLLLTRFLAPEGVGEISDFMPVHPREHTSRVVRRVKTVRGEIRYRVRCAPRFDYARAAHTAEPVEHGVVFTGADGTVLRLTSTVPLRIESADAVGEFTLAAGQTATFILEQVAQDCGVPYRSRRVRHGVLQGHDELLARVDQPLHLHRPLARRGPPLRADAQAAQCQVERLDRGRRDLRAPRDDRRGAQLGLPVLLDQGRLVHPVRADPTGHDRGDRCVHRLARRALRVHQTRDAPDALYHRRRHRSGRADPGPPGGLQGLAAGADRKRRVRPAAARHLRRAAGRDLSVRQVPGVHQLQPVEPDRRPGGLGRRELATARRRGLGGAQRPARVPLFPDSLLGRDRPGDPDGREAIVPGAAWRAGARRGTRSTARCTRSSGTRSSRRSWE